MNFFENLINSLKGTMETPGNYSVFHLVSIGLAIMLTVVLCIFFKNASNKTFRIVVGIAWGVMLVLEIYKQIIYSYTYENGVSNWSYRWHAFPFQLCSTPLYVLPLVVFLKEGKIRDAAMSFISTFAFVGGLVVFIYPNDVFESLIGINIQTMVHHGLQIVLAIYLMVYNRRKLNFKYFLSGISIFAIAFILANIFNLSFNTVSDSSINMFFVSPYVATNLPILSQAYAALPFIIYLVVYFIGFILAAYIVYAIQFGLIKLFGIKKNKMVETNE